MACQSVFGGMWKALNRPTVRVILPSLLAALVAPALAVGVGSLRSTAEADDQQHSERLLAELGAALLTGKPVDARVAALDLQGLDPTVLPYPPLAMAAGFGRDDVVELLLFAGFDPNDYTRPSNAPIVIAARRGHEAVVRQLRAAGAEVTPDLVLAARRRGAVPLAVTARRPCAPHGL